MSGVPRPAELLKHKSKSQGVHHEKAIDPIVRLNRLTGRTALWLACALLAGVSMTALAGNPWFTSRTVGGKTKPITLMAPSSPTGGSSLSVSSAATFDNGFVDVVVSLYKNPAGDDNGNAQANPPSEQDVIEQIVQFWADGMFEATQGAHVLRRVRIFRNGLLANKADVTWITSGWPSSSASGVNQAGGHINFADIFLGGCGSGCDYNMLTNPRGAGYTLAHEWGHYAYGLFDEYKIAATDIAIVPSIMNSQWNATGGDTRWLNYSIVNSGGRFPKYAAYLSTVQLFSQLLGGARQNASQRSLSISGEFRMRLPFGGATSFLS